MGFILRNHQLALFSVLIVLSIQGFAQTADQLKSSKSHNGIHVMPVDPHFPTESLEKEGYHVHSYERNPEKEPRSEIPDPQVRDAIFKKAKLASTVQDWDHFDRDMFYMTTWKLPLAQVQEKYPKIPATKIRELQRLIRSGAKK